jgi:hypothetical protein
LEKKREDIYSGKHGPKACIPKMQQYYQENQNQLKEHNLKIEQLKKEWKLFEIPANELERI